LRKTNIINHLKNQKETPNHCSCRWVHESELVFSCWSICGWWILLFCS